MKYIKLKKKEVLVLRSVDKNFQSRNRFQYPQKWKVICEDYEDNNICWNWLHWLEFGNTRSYDIYNDYKDIFLIIKVDISKWYNIIDNWDKVKFKEWEVMWHFEDYNSSIQWMRDNYPERYNMFVRDSQTAWYSSTQTAWYSSTQKAWDSSTQKAWYSSTQTAWGYSTQTAWCSSTQTAWGYSTQTAWYSSTQTAWGSSTQTAWGSSTQTAWYSSTQTAW